MDFGTQRRIERLLPSGGVAGRTFIFTEWNPRSPTLLSFDPKAKLSAECPRALLVR